MLILSEYNHEWPAEFERVSAELFLVFRELGTVMIEHIGSTAVPGLCAKPVLDVLAGASDLSGFESSINSLGQLGYRYRPEYEHLIPDRRYFVRQAGKQLRVHLHCVTFNGTLWRDHIGFRDALRNNSVLAAEYATLKRGLAEQFAHDKSAYTEAKAAFIRRVLKVSR